MLGIGEHGFDSDRQACEIGRHLIWIEDLTPKEAHLDNHAINDTVAATPPVSDHSYVEGLR
jgi:hypothetical protein